MSFRSLFDFLKLHSARQLARQTRRQAARRQATARPRLEQLEDRSLLSNYTFTDLFSLAGGSYGAVHDVNASGQVVGFTRDPNAGYNASAVLWDGTVVINLGTLGGTQSGAWAINDLGQIVGGATKPDGSYRAFLINPEDSDGNNTPDRWFRDLDADGANDLMVELPVPGIAIEPGLDINNLGQVVGGNFLWTPDTPNGTTGSVTPLGLSAAAINDAGQVVGSAWIDGWSHAVLWQNGVMTDLGYGAANDVNASGQVVGDSAAAGGFLWIPTSPNGTTGTLNFLEPVPGGYGDSASSALGVNDAGQVVGTSFSWSPGGPEAGGSEYKRATLWAGGEPQGLTQLVVPALSEALGSAVAINDSGQIIGDMFGWSFTPSGRPFLITPITVPLMTISNATVVEGNSGTVSAVFTVSLSAAYDQTVTVDVTTADDTATTGSDYQSVSGKLTIPAGHTSGTITVLVNGDRLGEPNETFFVNLSNPTNAVIANGQGVGTIVDDEPRVSISDVTKKEGNGKKKTLFVFTVTLSIAYDQPVTMSFRTVNGTATTSDGDYIAKSGTLTFAPGETTKTITIEVKGDSKRETNETFYLDLFDNSTNSLFTKSRGTGTMWNDD